MNRKRREANVRRALAAGRRIRPARSDLGVKELLHSDTPVDPSSIDAHPDAGDVRAKDARYS
jgi:hypothetical protein